ncbi:MAG: putative 2-hydroxyacid dehydrogenase [Firmicutes bacterium]|nr:putative 2-hydroxyacid dehydrogenase [Bacillota bacterium]
MKTVFLNVAKLDFDNKLNFSKIANLTTVTTHAASSDQEIIDRVSGQNIVITKELPVGGDIIAQFPSSVKLICEAGTGFNNIDLAAAREKGITVCNVPGYSTEAVAQLAVTFMLSLSASLSRQQAMLHQKDYTNFTKHLSVPHFEIQNKVLGIIGSGSIGQQVIKIARALGMNILVYNRTPKVWSDPQIKSVSLEELFRQSDFISLHCPLTPDTRRLVNKATLALMKASAFVINTSRGALINEPDLIEALQQGRIAGAALDVQDPEPPELTNPLFSMANVILTPHIGWKPLEARQRLINLLAGNIEAYLQGKPVNVVS